MDADGDYWHPTIESAVGPALALWHLRLLRWKCREVFKQQRSMRQALNLELPRYYTVLPSLPKATKSTKNTKIHQQ